MKLFLIILIFFTSQRIQAIEIENWKEIRQIFAKKEREDCQDFVKLLKVLPSNFFVIDYCKYDSKRQGIPLVLRLRVKGYLAKNAETWLMENFDLPAMKQGPGSYLGSYRSISPYKVDTFDKEYPSERKRDFLEIRMEAEVIGYKENKENWKDISYFYIEFAWFNEDSSP